MPKKSKSKAAMPWRSSIEHNKAIIADLITFENKEPTLNKFRSRHQGISTHYAIRQI